MPLQFSTVVRNARLDAVETAVGAAPVLRIRSGAAPGNLAAADTGTVLATLALPTDWMSNASNGVKALSGTWQDLQADATGTAGHFRVYASDGTTAHIQGSISMTGDGGDMTLDNTSIAVGQQITVTSFTLTEGNA
jgi:hypothetical protein